MENKRVTKQDIAKKLKSIGKPGKNQKEKIKAIEEMNLTNPQNINISQTLRSYREF